MIRSRIAFQHSSGGQVLATLEVTHGFDGDPASAFTVTAFDDENQLLQQVVLAALTEEETVDLVSKIILTVAGRPYDKPWVTVQASEAQYAVLGLRLPKPASERLPGLQGERSGLLSSLDLKVALQQTPVPLCLLEGPEHVITFINEGYVHIMGRTSKDQVLGQPIRDALTELRGQPFFNWLDQSYRSGEPFVGHETPARLFSYRTAKTEDFYFDFVYQPVRDAQGEVCGILAQATDVTERVLDKHVREAREAQLYSQWAELDALYRTSPVGMALIRASDFSIQRINDHNAALLGRPADELLGLGVEQFYPNQPFIGRMLRRVVQHRAPCSVEIVSQVPASPGLPRRWHWSLNPILNAVGEVESIASLALEMTEHAGDVEILLGTEAGDTVASD
jgi:PAS domain-containing protein